MRCPKCNFPVLPKFDICPKCGSPLKEEAAVSRPATDFDFDAPVPKPAAEDLDFDASAPVRGVSKVPRPVDGVSIISGKVVWSLGPGQIARRVTEREMADCGAVRGVVVQDGVTAAVFSDGKLLQTLDGGIYRFSNETIVRDGKRQTITPQGTVAPASATPPEPKPEEKKRGFLSRLFGASKETPAAPKAAPTSAPKPVVKPAVTVQRNTSVVVIYLISNRVFEESFGSAGSVDYVPFEVTASGTPLKVGASMQMRVTDFETFRRQYLVDSNEVSVETMRRLMSPWVKQILAHAFATIQVTDGRLTPDQQESLKQTLGSMLQNRLFGLSIINIFDLVTRDEDFERLSEQQRELAKAERENEFYVRETEFRNRLADFEARQEAERLTKENDANLTREKEYARYETALAELNRDKLLTEDELKQFMAQHEMEMRLAEASRNADEQTRRYESEKILNDLADRKLIDDDERKMIEERFPRLSMVDTAVNDNVDAMAALICSFDAREMDIPLLDIDRLTVDCPRQQLLRNPEYCRFGEPVRVAGISAVAYGFEFRTPMGRGLSGLRVKIEGRDETIPIEAFTHYSNLSALRDAIVKAREKAQELEKTVRRIMIVPDYFTPHDSPTVLDLRRKLEEKGYRVTVFCAGNTLEKSRRGLERICKRRHYDLILTIETGCLLAARLSASHRIYVNPDWTAWEWMKLHLGEEKVLFEHRGDHEGPMFSYRIDRDEIDMARDMAQRYNIRKGDKMSLGWFSEDIVETGEDSRLIQEHMKRFGSAAYPPHIGLDTDTGIAALANETDKILKSDES